MALLFYIAYNYRGNSESKDRVVVFYPVAYHDGAVLRGGGADDNALDTGVYDLALAHRAAHRIAQKLVRARVTPDEVDGRSYHVAAGGGDDGVGFGVDAAAELIALAGGDVQALAGAYAEVCAVAAAARRAVVAGGDNLVRADDYRPVLAPEAGGALQNGVCNIEIIILLACAAVHSVFPQYFS